VKSRKIVQLHMNADVLVALYDDSSVWQRSVETTHPRSLRLMVWELACQRAFRP